MAQRSEVLGADFPCTLLMQDETYVTDFLSGRLDAVSSQLELSCCIPHAAAESVTSMYDCLLPA